MSIFRCKMCGGNIEFEQGASVGTCDHCGTKQTLPKTDDDMIANLFNRANNLRLKCEFDKAEQIYEKIVQQDDGEAEAHWGIVLCKYGIEYVEDPKTHQRIPTCHRTLFEAVTADPDYVAAVDYSDAQQQVIYESEARAIDRIQRDILAIVKNEKPFDVFICYKETDENGKRTIDSAIANDIYYQLTQEGLKVFYAAITLEEKLGQEYEPYIFAALNSAKVMLVIGTKPEHFNAVWVKNEWGRYLRLMKSDRSKLLIPCYRDMDAYDLPEEFAHLQAQDMSKIGFINDVVRGIKKVVKVDAPKPAADAGSTAPKAGVSAGVGAAPLLKRAFMFLEDGEWEKADDFCEQVLNQDPENAQAYLGKLMAELRVCRQDDLPDCEQPFDGSSNFQKAVRFGGDEISSVLNGYIAHINERNENARVLHIYNKGIECMKAAHTEEDYKKSAGYFAEISGFKDADELRRDCLEKAIERRNDALYSSALNEKTAADEAKGTKIAVDHYQKAILILKGLNSWKNSENLISVCEDRIREIGAKQEADRLEAERKAEERRIAKEKAAKKRKKIVAIVTPIIAACIAFVIVLTTVIIPKQKLNRAMELLDTGDYEAAYALLEELGDSDAVVSSKYNRAIALIDSGDYEAAYMLLNGLDYKDSADKRAFAIKEHNKALLHNAQVGSYVRFGSYEQDDNVSNGKEDIEWLVLAKEEDKILVISRYVLDRTQYNTYYTNVTWETCSLREWLNETFINAAFSTEEQSIIMSSAVTADNNPSHSTSPGNDTTDKVFLLSITEVNRYFASDSARQCAATAYAIAHGAYTNADNGGSWWWLRSPGDNSSNAAGVDSDGLIRDQGTYVSYSNGAVRPALWIDLG